MDEIAAELPITARRLLSIFWLCMWRGVLGGAIFGLVSAFAINVGAAFFGLATGYYLSGQSAASTSAILGGVLGFCWSFFVLKMALKKKYRDFRIALVQMNQH